MALSSPGIGSNLDVANIVKQLMAVEAQPLTTLAKKEASFQAKLSAYGSLRGVLGSFQTALASLSDPEKFRGFSAVSSDLTIATATASSQATMGSYKIDITALAQAQTIASSGQASATAAIGTGTTTTLTFQFGTIGGGTTPIDGIYPAGTTFTQNADQATGTVTIDSSNNSLQGIRDAINKAGIGVTATIISDGSESPNRLVLSSNATGIASSMKITVDGDATLQDLLGYDPANVAGQNLTQSAAAQNTSLTIDGIAISSATKTVNDAIQGVTLIANKIGTSTLSVTRNTASVSTSIDGFVKAYNDLNKTLKELTAYNPTTRIGGPLIGDATVRSIQNEIRQMFNKPIPELLGSIRNLSDVGIAFQKDGTLAVNATKLSSAISNNFDDIAALFAPFGSVTDSLISVSASGKATKPGQYAINLTSIATRGSQIGSVDLNAALTVIDADTTFNVSLDGVGATVTLVAGSYSAQDFAAMLQSAINGTSVFSSAGVSVKAEIDGNGFLNTTSNRYGSSSSVNITSATGTSVTTILGAATTTSAGVDVGGSIGGVKGSGSGQVLSGSIGSAADGLKLLVSDGSTGDRGSINFSRGYADQLNMLIGTFLGTSGLISGRTNGLSNSIKDIDRTREAMNTRLIATEKRYRAQFNALDTAISNMMQTSSFLQQQLANLPKIDRE